MAVRLSVRQVRAARSDRGCPLEGVGVVRHSVSTGGEILWASSWARRDRLDCLWQGGSAAIGRMYQGQSILVDGVLQIHRDLPRIVVTLPRQIKVVPEKKTQA